MHHIKPQAIFSTETVMLAMPDGQEGDKAILMSPHLSVNTPSDFCVQFHFIQYGAGSGALALEKHDANAPATLLWEVCASVALFVKTKQTKQQQQQQKHDVMPHFKRIDVGVIQHSFIQVCIISVV